jgi:transposase
MRKTNKLNSIQSAKLYQFLENDKDATRSISANGLAAQASTALGFNVTAVHVDHLRRGMGLNPQKARREKPVKLTPIRILAREIIALKTALGAPPSCAELVALADA